MITPDEFKVLSDKINSGDALTVDEAKQLLTVVYELDASMVILQNTLELSIMNVKEILPEISEVVLRLSGRTDKKIKKKVATIAGRTAANFDASIQLYLAGAFEEAQNIINKLGEENDTDNTEISKDTN